MPESSVACPIWVVWRDRQRLARNRKGTTYVHTYIHNYYIHIHTCVTYVCTHTHIAHHTTLTTLTTLSMYCTYGARRHYASIGLRSGQGGSGVLAAPLTPQLIEEHQPF